jgi:hypothetical protein
MSELVSRAGPSTHDAYRRRIRIAAICTLASQALVLGVFFSGLIREPYPALILPSFDSVLVRGSTYQDIVPRVIAETANGIVISRRVPELMPRLPTYKTYWLVSYLAPPDVSGEFRPTLPSWGFRVTGPPSPRQVQALSELVAPYRRQHDLARLTVVWEVREYRLSKQGSTLVRATEIGRFEIPPTV